MAGACGLLTFGCLRRMCGADENKLRDMITKAVE